MIPFVRDLEFSYGIIEAISPLIRRIIANNPGPYTFIGTGTYLIGKQGNIAVIDPGPDDADHIRAIVRQAGGPITDIFITHTHKDHCGGTDRLRSATGATIHGFGAHPSTPDMAPPALEEGADFEFEPENTLTHEETISSDDWTISAVHTPGHTPNHLCYALEQENALFTGDHIMGWSTTVIAPPDGVMEDYLASLTHLLERSTDVRYYPTHGAPIDDPHTFVKAIQAHRHQRDKDILAAITSAPQNALEIVARVYTDTDPKLHGAAALNVMAHLARHVRSGQVRHEEARYWLSS